MVPTVSAINMYCQTAILHMCIATPILLLYHFLYHFENDLPKYLLDALNHYSTSFIFRWTTISSASVDAGSKLLAVYYTFFSFSLVTSLQIFDCWLVSQLIMLKKL